MATTAEQTPLQLESRCTDCEGRGGHEERGQWYRCPYCQGAGYLPTEEGKRILALMRHNFPVMLRQTREAEGWEE